MKAKSKFVPISFTSNKILKLILNSSTNDTSKNFVDLFEKIKDENEKNAISLLVIGVGNVYCSGHALEYAVQKFNMSKGFALRYIPKKEIVNFWKYLPSFANSNKALTNYFHLFLPFLPKDFDVEILNKILTIKGENQIILSTYADSMQDSFVKFLKKSFIDNFPTPSQIQHITRVLLQRKKVFIKLLQLIDEHKDNVEHRFVLEYSLIIALSEVSESLEMLNNYSTVIMLFLLGTVDFKSQLFDSLCFYVNRILVPLNPPSSLQEYEDYPFYLLRTLKNENVASMKKIIKQSIENIQSLTPISIYFLFSVKDEKLYRSLSAQLIQLEQPLPIVQKILQKGKELKDNNILNFINHVACALFVRTPLDHPSFKSIAELMQQISEINYPIQFFSKNVCMLCNENLKDLAIDLLNSDNKEKSSILIGLHKFIQSDLPISKIEQSLVEQMNNHPDLAIHAFIALCSSKSLAANEKSKTKLISLMKEIILQSFAEKNIQFEATLSAIPEIGDSAHNFQDLFEYLKNICGKDSDFNFIDDLTFQQSIQKVQFV